MRVRLLLIGTTLVIASCGSSLDPQTAPAAPEPSSTGSEPPISSTTTSTSTTSASPSVATTSPLATTTTPLAGNNSVLVSWSLDATRDWADTAADPVALEACRWRGPQRYDIDLRWDPTTDDGPVDLVIDISLLLGDTGTSFPIAATVSGPGSFTIPLTNEWDDPDEYSAARASRWSLQSEWAMSCGIGRAASGTPTSIEVMVDPAPRTAAADTIPGSVEAIAAAIDVADITEPLLPLALLDLDAVPPIDVLYIVTGRLLDDIDIDETGGCIEIRTLYDTDGDGGAVELTQVTGCPGLLFSDGTEQLPVGDDRWDLFAWADGPPVLPSALTALPFGRAADVAPVPIDAFDADGFLDAWLDDRKIQEVIRFDWQGGRVAVYPTWETTWGFEYEPKIATEDLFNGGAGAIFCREWGVYVSDDGSGRILGLVFTTDGRTAVVKVATDGQPAGSVVPTRPTSVDGLSAGIVDLTGTGRTETDTIVVTEPDGSPSPCTQN